MKAWSLFGMRLKGWMSLVMSMLGYYVDNGVLLRSWRPLNTSASDHWMVKSMVPQVYRNKILESAHEGNVEDSVYHPQSQGCVERFHQTEKKKKKNYQNALWGDKCWMGWGVSSNLVCVEVKYVSDFKDILMSAREIARENLKGSQSEMKGWYDR